MDINILDDDLPEGRPPVPKWPFILLYILVFVGAIFKVMHWPGGSVILLSSGLILSIYSLIALFRGYKKDHLLFTLGVFGVVLILFIINRMFF